MNGVVRALGAADDVAAALREQGWVTAVVEPAYDDTALWDGLAAALDLPDWFGRNLDALDEILRDLERPTALVLATWQTYARARPERWQRVLALLVAHADGRRFAVALAD